MFELLSPGGDLEKIQTAFHFGADAVYVGGPSMQLRAQAAAMNMQNLAEGIRYAHSINKKLYVTVNAFARNEDIIKLPDYLTELKSIGADAVIVSDIGVLSVAAKTVPDLAVHISTQASCLNYKAANMYYELGASRIVLARELSLSEISEIRAKTPQQLELEAFVHGAMCMAYSGRCLISAYLTGRDSNKGDCTQPCRWKYRLVEEKRPNEYFPISESDDGTTLLSSKDLNTLSIIEQIKAAGITSFKIEGRMKSAYYVATVTNAYRHALDGTAPLDILEKEVRAVSHREYSTGFYSGELKRSKPANDGYVQDCVFVAVVKEYSHGVAQIEMRNRFTAGDTLEVVTPEQLGQKFKVTAMYDEEGKKIATAYIPQQKVTLDCPVTLRPGDMLRRRNVN